MNNNTDFYFQWHITNACNNRCKHCYHADYKTSNELSIADILRVADLIDDSLNKWNFTGSLSITGGEPFTNRDNLFTLLEHIDNKCVRIGHYDILTNGTLIDENDISFLKKLKKLRRIQVSLEGADSESHDCVRGFGDFVKVVQTIKRLKETDFIVSVMTTLTRNNKILLPKIIEFLGKLKVDYFALERFMPEGQGGKNEEWVLSKEEIKQVFSYMTDVALKKGLPHILLYRTLYCLCSNDETIGAMCSAGVNALTIMPDATLFPCRRLPIPIGNVLKEGIIKTWYNSEILWNLRDPAKYKGKCAKCDHFLECRGCRSMAYLHTGDYLQEDPQCWK